jgi:anthranilate phosphoribosyltransferase
LSCAGPTHCWQLSHGKIEHFRLHPSDFGLPCHKLSEISPGLSASENAAILLGLLEDKTIYEGILHFVLMNTAALLVIAGVCDADESDMGPEDDGKVIFERGPGGGRWKEGVRRARWAIKSGQALRSWQAFVEISNSINAR